MSAPREKRLKCDYMLGEIALIAGGFAVALGGLQSYIVLGNWRDQKQAWQWLQDPKRYRSEIFQTISVPEDCPHGKYVSGLIEKGERDALWQDMSIKTHESYYFGTYPERPKGYMSFLKDQFS